MKTGTSRPPSKQNILYNYHETRIYNSASVEIVNGYQRNIASVLVFAPFIKSQSRSAYMSAIW